MRRSRPDATSCRTTALGERSGSGRSALEREPRIVGACSPWGLVELRVVDDLMTGGVPACAVPCSAARSDPVAPIAGAVGEGTTLLESGTGTRTGGTGDRHPGSGRRHKRHRLLQPDLAGADDHASIMARSARLTAPSAPGISEIRTPDPAPGHTEQPPGCPGVSRVRAFATTGPP